VVIQQSESSLQHLIEARQKKTGQKSNCSNWSDEQCCTETGGRVKSQQYPVIVHLQIGFFWMYFECTYPWYYCHHLYSCSVNSIIWACTATNLQVASWMTVAVITSMTAYLYLYSRGMVFHAASQPVSTASPFRYLITIHSAPVASLVPFAICVKKKILSELFMNVCI
jgi:hypothetical protein